MKLRVKYYGPNDASTGASLQRVAELIRTQKAAHGTFDINDILEFYNISLLFEHKLFLKEWDSETIKQYTEAANNYKSEIKNYMHSLNTENLALLYEHVDSQYKDDFFKVISAFNVYDRITDEQFNALVLSFPYSMNHILQNKPIVKKFSRIIADQLENNVAFTELLIDHYYVNHDDVSTKNTYIPAEFNASESLNSILNRYIELPEANFNYLKLIANLKKTNNYPINEIVQFKAKERANNYQKDHFSSTRNGLLYPIVISVEDQEDIVKEVFDSSFHTYKLSYSKLWISDHLDYPTLYNNFIYLFNYVDLNGRCQFLSKPNQLGIIERTMGIHGPKEYQTGIGYQAIDTISCLQMDAYITALKCYGIEIEQMFKWFFEEYLKTEFSVDHYSFTSPSDSASLIEKILMITNQLDSVLKQFQLFVENGVINRELFEFTSSGNRISNIKSLLKKKYLYPNSSEIKKELNFLFSDQCMLSYTEKTGSKYNTFADLLLNEDVKISDYYEFNHVALNWLLERGTISENACGYLYIPSATYTVLNDLNANGCISYLYCRRKEKELVDNMIAKGDLLAESSLFTRWEADYLDYMLNNKQFSNGPELRNKYAHGTFPSDLAVQQTDYIELLKIMTLYILKINEEFCLMNPSDDELLIQFK